MNDRHPSGTTAPTVPASDASYEPYPAYEEQGAPTGYAGYDGSASHHTWGTGTHETFGTAYGQDDPLFGTLPGSYDTGHYGGTGQYDASQFGAEQFGTEQFGTEQFGTGQYDATNWTADGTQQVPGYDTAYGTGGYAATEANGYGVPGYDAQVYDTSAYDPSAYDTATYDPSAYDTPTYDPSAYDTPTYDASAYDTSTYDASAYDTSTYDASGYDAAGRDATGYDAYGLYTPTTYETGSYAADGYATGGYDPSGYDTAVYDPALYDGYDGHDTGDATAAAAAAAAPGVYDGADAPVSAEPGTAESLVDVGDTAADASYADAGYDADTAEAAGVAGDAADEDTADDTADGDADDAMIHAAPIPAPRRLGGNRRTRRMTPGRSAMLTVAVPSVAVMGVAGIAAASVTMDAGQDTKTTQASPDTSGVKAAANSKLDTQLASLTSGADDFADRASRTQERIDLKQRQLEEKKRREAEAARREAMRPKFLLPVKQHGLSAYFGQAGINWMSIHTGIDFPVSLGTPVMAATDGTVRTQWNNAYGNMAIVTAPDGTETWYCHLSSTKIRSGSVQAGTVIAYSGNSGNSTGPHLHFEVHPGGGSAVDPLPWLRNHGLDPT